MDFDVPDDGRPHTYCASCRSETVISEQVGDRKMFRCAACGKRNERSIFVDGKAVWWIDPETKDYWHESVGVFIRDRDGKVLLFDRTQFPFAFTMPAGHLDRGETPEDAAKREVEEEVGIRLERIRLIAAEDLAEPCRRGSDHHRWHLYGGSLPEGSVVRMSDEGIRPAWVSKEDALRMNLTVPTRYFLEKYGNAI